MTDPTELTCSGNLSFEFLAGDRTPLTLPIHLDTGKRQFPFHVLVNNSGANSRAETALSIFRVLDGESILIRRDEPHRLRMLRGGPKPVSIWCHFRAELFHSVDFLDFFELPEKFTGDAARAIRESCEALLDVHTAHPLQELLHRQSAGLLLLEAITRDATPRRDAAERLDDLARLAPAIEFMERHLSAPPSLAEIAARAHLSESRFTVLFKRAMHCPPGSWLRRLRLARAHELLSRPGMTPTAVAAELGFYDVFHFSHQFKRQFGITPTGFLRGRHRSPAF